MTADEFVSRVEAGDIEMVRLFIEAGMDVNSFNSYGITALMPASGNGNVEMVKLLIDAGAEVNVADPDFWTPLMWAERAGNSEVAEILRKAGALEGRLKD